MDLLEKYKLTFFFFYSSFFCESQQWLKFMKNNIASFFQIHDHQPNQQIFIKIHYYRDMQSQGQPNQNLKLLGIGAATFIVNYIFTKVTSSPRKSPADVLTEHMIESERQIMLKSRLKMSRRQILEHQNKSEAWGRLKVEKKEKEQPLIEELRLMDSLLFEVERVNNLIVDLELKNFQGIRNPIIRWKKGKNSNQSYMHETAMVEPGEFVIRQCVFKPGLTLELQKKFLRAGPRGSLYFDPEHVRADIVCLGNISPGMNTVIRELFLVLRNNYRVQDIFGVKNSFTGYYENKIIKLTQEDLQTVHHEGGCYLGLCKSQFNVPKIVDNLEHRNINQLYLIGANSTLVAAKAIYLQIRKRKANIAMTVLLKGINKDIPIFDTCFGFQTAAEEAAKNLEKAYAYSHSFTNAISLLRLPGKKSGFLAAQTVLSTINANICLVPEIPFDLYGEKGLLNYVIRRMKVKGNCTIAYSEGVESAIRDCCIKKQEGDSTDSFQALMKKELERMLSQQNITPHKIGVLNAVEQIRASPANSIDTKLCCQIAQASIHGLMSGYTNFATGHLASKSTMIPIDELIHADSATFLKEHDAMWQRVLGATGQPNFLNHHGSDSI